MHGNGTLTYGQMFTQLSKQLPSAFEARQLFSFITGIEPYGLAGMRDVAVPREQMRHGAELCARRLAGEPLQYLLGEWEFYGVPLFVGEGVLIPRADTELLVDIALSLAAKLPEPEVLDLCSGSGCIPIAIASKLPGAAITAVELSPAAFDYLTRNIERNQVQVKAVQADIVTYTHHCKAGVITANPPYIPEADLSTLQAEVGHEPRTALCGGKDGLDFYRVIASRYHDQLKPGGYLCFEVGINQSESVAEILTQFGYTNITAHLDLCGIQRVVVGVAKT